MSPLNNPGDALVGEGHITVMPWNYYSITAGTFAIESSAVAPYTWFRNTTSAINDQINYNIYLATGSYIARFQIKKNTDSGTFQILKNGTLQESGFDCYAAAEASAVLSSSAISIASSGLYTLGIKINTKNAGSSSYQCVLGPIGLWRTA